MSIDSSGPIKQSIAADGNYTVLLTDSSGYNDGDTFKITYTPQNSLYIATINDIKFYKMFKSYSSQQYSNNLNITLNNSEGFSSPD